MGAWGLGLFQSDHDLDVVFELDNESRMLVHDMAIRSLQRIKIMSRLSKAAGTGKAPQATEAEAKEDSKAEDEEVGEEKLGDEPDWATKKMLRVTAVEIQAMVSRMAQGLPVQETDMFDVARGEDATDAFIRHEFHHSLYAKDCSRPAHVRRLLEQEPNLITEGQSMVKELIEKYEKETEKEQKLRNPYGAGYKLVILGACFMSLGCTLPDSFRATLKRIYPEVGLMRDAQKQMRKALGDGPRGYKNGQPYDFGSLDANETQHSGGSKARDRMYPDSRVINCPAPNDFAPGEVLESLDDGLKERLRVEKICIKASAGEEILNCAQCNATQGADNAALLCCGRCKRVKYCGRECQRSDWISHKVICASLARGLGKDQVFIGNRDPTFTVPGWKVCRFKGKSLSMLYRLRN